jgi:hypothetical protein
MAAFECAVLVAVLVQIAAWHLDQLEEQAPLDRRQAVPLQVTRLHVLQMLPPLAQVWNEGCRWDVVGGGQVLEGKSKGTRNGRGWAGGWVDSEVVGV